MFLESQQIIDYSLLVGLHFRAPEQLKSFEPPDTRHTLETLLANDGRRLILQIFFWYLLVVIVQVIDFSVLESFFSLYFE